MKARVIACLGVVPALWAARARAEANPWAIELSSAFEYGRLIVPTVDHSREVSAQNGGLALSVAGSLRSPYFLAPYLELGYAQLYASEEQVTIVGAGSERIQSSLSTTWFQAGAGLDVWRFRVRGGLGFYRLRVESRVLGETVIPTEIDYGYSATVSGFFYQSNRLRLGTDARLLLIAEAETASIAFGLTVAGDAVSW